RIRICFVLAARTARYGRRGDTNNVPPRVALDISAEDLDSFVEAWPLDLRVGENSRRKRPTGRPLPKLAKRSALAGVVRADQQGDGARGDVQRGRPRARTGAESDSREFERLHPA